MEKNQEFAITELGRMVVADRRKLEPNRSAKTDTWPPDIDILDRQPLRHETQLRTRGNNSRFQGDQPQWKKTRSLQLRNSGR